MMYVTEWDDLPRAIAVAQQAGAIGLTHLLRALYTGRIAFLPLMPDMTRQRLREFDRRAAGKPAVVLIGDDDGLGRGPSGWRGSMQALRWAKARMIHAAGGELGHYEAVIQAAERVGKAVIVECGTATAPTWIEAVNSLQDHPSQALLIWPRNGVHPIAPVLQ